LRLNKKTILSILLIALMLTQIFNTKVFAESSGVLSSKEEVVYSTLSTDGKVNGIYVVNILDITKSGTINDYGNYLNIKNLTNLKNINSNEDNITINAEEGKFYYQGNDKSTDLPWIFNIKYILDNKEIQAKDLAGKSGKLKIEIDTTQNKVIDSSFYENYMLQISVKLDNKKCKNITAENGVFANSGKDKLITFTVMPNTDLSASITTDVSDFEMKGITITAVPFSMTFDLPDTKEMTKDLVTLSEAITQLNAGTIGLVEGVKFLNIGMNQLKDGSNNYHAGINALNNQSSEITEASKNINDSLGTINSSLNALSEQLTVSMPNTEISITLAQLSQALGLLTTNYSSFNNGLTAYTGGLSQLATSYNSINDGITSMANGTASLNGGIGKMADGTKELNNQTKDLPNQIDTAIDELMSEYDFSDYKPISFVSGKNQNVKSVQFIISTENIEKEKTITKVEILKKDTFWERLKNLFRK